ncbi:unnamed protein product [Ranitomeya imitator]|uniref:PAZ domain-containing protein n=1 Tax=Ranitomeya imitator TaxID=111125 RepID=A0ABN9LNI3_9NEOB|nr:unnamed protein product [Ranitomeya imitator]
MVPVSPNRGSEKQILRLSLWKGFSTVVSFLEKQLTLSVDVSHKVLRNETVLESMIELFSRVPKERFTEVCEKEFVGMVVLTRYNNKTYRVDDMDWSTKPTDRFPKKDGTQISYVEYYKQQYNVELTDLSQPMLVSTLKVKKGEGCDVPRVVHLLPELCYLTGLSSRALSDIRLMRDLSAETQLNPELRQRRLQSLAENIQESREASSELAKWGVTLDRQLPVTGRVVPTEKICLRDNFCQPDSAADWSRNTKNGRMIYAKPLSNWIMLFGHRNADVAEKLTHCLIRVGEGMGFPIDYPKIDHVAPLITVMNMRLHPYGSGVHIHYFNERYHVTAEQGKKLPETMGHAGTASGMPGAVDDILSWCLTLERLTSHPHEQSFVDAFGIIYVKSDRVQVTEAKIMNLTQGSSTAEDYNSSNGFTARIVKNQ